MNKSYEGSKEELKDEYEVPGMNEVMLEYWFWNQHASITFGAALFEDTITKERQIRFGVVGGNDLKRDLETLAKCCRRLEPETLMSMHTKLTATGKIRR